MTTRQTPDAVREGMFADWSTKTLADQCHMQAGEQLDPEVTQFMTAVGNRLAALDSRAGDAGEPMGALLICDQTGGCMHTSWPVPDYQKLAANHLYGDRGGYRTVPLYAATAAPAVDAVPAGEVDHAVSEDWEYWLKDAESILRSNGTTTHAYKIAEVRTYLSAALSHGEGRK